MPKKQQTFKPKSWQETIAQGSVYWESADIIRNKITPSVPDTLRLDIAAITMQSLAVELFLKGIAAKEKNEYIKDHKLDDLYNDLSSHSKSVILKCYNNTSGEEELSEVGFLQRINQCAGFFINSRYILEGYSLMDISFFKLFSDSVYAYAYLLHQGREVMLEDETTI